MPDDASTPWKVGVLFSRSGVTGLTETEHFLGTALAVEEINAAGGVRGRPIEPLCLDANRAAAPGRGRSLDVRTWMEIRGSAMRGTTPRATNTSRPACRGPA